MPHLASPRPSPRRRPDGFTLIEVLVALVLTGFVLLLLNQGVRFGWSTDLLGSRVQTAMMEQETTFRALRHLIADAAPPDVSGQEGGLTGSAHAASFVARLPEGFGAPGTGEADVTLGVMVPADGQGHRLELLWRPHYRRWIIPPPAPSAHVLLDHVERLDIQYLRPGSGDWLTTWSVRAFPRLIRLRIVFPAGDPRHWPDLVVAPMRSAATP